MINIIFTDNCVEAIGFHINKKYKARQIINQSGEIIYEVLNEKNEFKYIPGEIIGEI